MGTDVAIDLTGDDEEMQRAIALSLQETVGGPIDVNAMTSDEQLAYALKQSSNDNMVVDTVQQQFQPLDPESNKRNRNTEFAGLANMGNTCYVNALLQTYYMIPQFQQAVITAQLKDITPQPQAAEATDKMDTSVDETSPLPVMGPSLRPDDETDKKYSVEFVEQLRLLFGFLALSDYKSISTHNCLSALKDRNGKVWQVGNQEDVSEFNDLFLHRLETGIKSPIVHELMFGKTTVIIDAEEADGTPVSTRREESFTNLGLPLQLGDAQNFSLTIYDLLERSLVDDAMEYTTPKDLKTESARKTVWLQKIPPILMFLAGRVTYDKTTQQFQKVHAPVTIEHTIYLDRYMEENREATESIRKDVAEYQRQLRESLNETYSFKNYRNRGIGLDDALALVSEFCFGQHQSLQQTSPRDTRNMETLAKTCQYLQQQLHSVNDTLKELADKQAAIQKQISGCFNLYNDEIYHKHRYDLHAVVMHSGSSANSGHYWAYVRDYSAADIRWIKFNDAVVNTVEDQVVQSEALAGSVYCLFYLDTSKVDPKPLTAEQIHSLLPEKVVQYVEAENRDLAQKIEAFKNRSDGLVKAYRSARDESMRLAKNQNAKIFECDHRLRSFPTFLYSLDKNELGDIVLLQDMYYSYFGRTLAQDKQNPPKEYLDTKRLINNDNMFEKTASYDRQSSDFKALADDFVQFRKIAQATEYALRKMQDSDLLEALPGWASAVSGIRKLKNSIKYMNIVNDMFDYTVYALYNNFLPMVTASNVAADTFTTFDNILKAGASYGSKELLKFLQSDFAGSYRPSITYALKSKLETVISLIKSKSSYAASSANNKILYLFNDVATHTLPDEEYGRLIASRQQAFHRVEMVMKSEIEECKKALKNA
jgi:ubiquitin carboxyl-terminal hydrolase 25/28